MSYICKYLSICRQYICILLIERGFRCVVQFEFSSLQRFCEAIRDSIYLASIFAKVRLDDNIRHPRRTRCQARGASLHRRDYICRGGQHRRSGWFQAVRSRREEKGRGRGLDVNAAPSPSPPLPNPFSTRNRAIYRPLAGQPSLPFPRCKGGKSRVSRQNRDGRR